MTNSAGGNAGSAPRTAAGKASNLLERVLSALVLGPVTLAVVWAGGLPFLVMVAVSAVLCAYEWQSMIDGGRIPLWARAVGCSLVLAALGVYVWLGVFSALGVSVVGGLALTALAREGDRWLAGLAVPYAALGTVALIWLRFEPAGGLLPFLFLLLVVWACDIGAYAAGRTIGGPKLAPRISPAKTWAGLIGGAVCSGAIGVGFGLWLGGATRLAAVAAFLAVAAQVGDLLESALKRRCKVKDSGQLIPGHGGLLDRIDGLMVAAPVLALLQAMTGLELAWP